MDDVNKWPWHGNILMHSMHVSAFQFYSKHFYYQCVLNCNEWGFSEIWQKRDCFDEKKQIENCETKVHGLKFQWLNSFVHCATKNSKFHNIIQCMYLWKYSMSRQKYFHIWYRTCCFSFRSLIQLTFRDADACFPEKKASGIERRQYKFHQK